MCFQNSARARCRRVKDSRQGQVGGETLGLTQWGKRHTLYRNDWGLFVILNQMWRCMYAGHGWRRYTIL